VKEYGDTEGKDIIIGSLNDNNPTLIVVLLSTGTFNIISPPLSSKPHHTFNVRFLKYVIETVIIGKLVDKLINVKPVLTLIYPSLNVRFKGFKIKVYMPEEFINVKFTLMLLVIL
jgi:hypothetical protein